MSGLERFNTEQYRSINAARWEVAKFVIDRLAGLGLETAYDVGCGPGWFSRRLVDLGLTVTGLEPRRELLLESRRSVPGAKFLEFNADLPAPGNELPAADFVLCYGLLYHLENPFNAVRRVRALTRSACLLESQMLPAEQPMAQFVEESRYITQGLTRSALVLSPAALVKMLYVSGFKNVYEFTAPIAHREFVATATHFKRRQIFLATYAPVSIDHLRRQAEPPAPKPDWARAKPRGWRPFLRGR